MSKIILLIFLISCGTSCQNSQKEIDAKSKLFEIELLSGNQLLQEAESDIMEWKELRLAIQNLEASKRENAELIRLDKNLDRFITKLVGYKRELQNWNNMNNDFSTMKKKNVIKMSNRRLKAAKDINKNIVKLQGTGNRVAATIKKEFLNK